MFVERFAFRWFNVWGVSFASEKKMRVRANELIEDHLTSELGPFSFPDKEGGEEVKSAPYVYVSSLWSKVHALLDQHDKYVTFLLDTKRYCPFVLFLTKGVVACSGMVAEYLKMKCG